MKPLFVKILSPNGIMSSGKPRALRCETLGSHPAARLSWLLDGEVIRSQPITVSFNYKFSNLLSFDIYFSNTFKFKNNYNNTKTIYR